MLLCTMPLRAQTPEPETTEPFSDLSALTVEDYSALQLPPLHVLMENARKSPQVSVYASNKEFEERELKTVRRSWLKNIKLNANYSYGSTDINSQLYYNNQYPVIQNISGSDQSWWSVGAGISLPLDEIFNRRNKIKQQQKKIEAIQYETERWHDEICMLIIEAYTTATANLAVLESSARSLVMARAQYAVAEADFINGKIDASTLSRQKTIESSATQEYEKTRATLNNALLRLEVLSKTQILKR
ncbi:MAG: TolC family protein [Alistipes sp.]